MDSVQENLTIWHNALVAKIPLAGLQARNPVVYKWKAPFRCWVLREAAFWRTTDLLTQSHALHELQHGLGARILLRSAFETLATLIFLNHMMRKVVDDEFDFHCFSRRTIALAIGSRDGSTGHEAINVLTMLDRGNERYPGLRKLYDSLSESAHPNYEGMIAGYSKPVHEDFKTEFSNRWMQTHGKNHLNAMELCMMSFQFEYDTVWRALMDKLESWIEENDARLEATRNDDFQK